MSVKSRCLSFAYGQSSREGTHLHALITKLDECQLTDKEAILHFLLLLANSKDDLGGHRGVLNDSGVCMMGEGQDLLFDRVPRLCDVDSLHSALTSSQQVSHSGTTGKGEMAGSYLYRFCTCYYFPLQLFECTPGSGFRGWSSQLPLNKECALPPSSLLGGLTHTKLSDINRTLDLPRLLPGKPVTMTTHPVAELPFHSPQPHGIPTVTMVI